MRSQIIFGCFCTLALALPCTALNAETLKCPGGLVSTGDQRIDLLAKCGEPDARDSHAEEVTQYATNDLKRKSAITTVDDWTYNFGPGQFLRIVTIKNGTISAIKTGNYGYVKGSNTARRDCTEQVVKVGDTQGEVVNRCGEPASKESSQEEDVVSRDSQLKRSVYVNVEKWTYNLGPHSFIRILTFRNGKLSEIKSGGYGY
jgi:hypothetical protein